MLQKVRISNFKSINNSEFELGRVNVLIGENGSGKSNVIEAIGFLSGFIDKKLDSEFLVSRGIRNTEPKYFKSLFEESNLKKPISYDYTIEGYPSNTVSIDYDESDNKWVNESSLSLKHYSRQEIEDLVTGKKELVVKSDNKLEELFLKFVDFGKSIANIKDEIKKAEALKVFSEVVSDLKNITKEIDDRNSQISNFLFFSCENSALRNFRDEQQIQPLGIRGEGLFKELQRLYGKRNKKQIDTIISELQLLDWFDSIEIPKNSFIGEKRIKIKDRYLSTLEFLDQRITNEGFLYLLFYLTLIVSEKTPKFFAIDNIDSSFNPKLCTELVRRITKLAKSFNKQIILTTHNPFVIDGLDLTDSEQRLLVVRRNVKGYTIVNPVQTKSDLKVKLSEAWMRGYIGGLPNNF